MLLLNGFLYYINVTSPRWFSSTTICENACSMSTVIAGGFTENFNNKSNRVGSNYGLL